MSQANIYTVGGTVQAGDGLYLKRKADDELFNLCLEGKYAHVLTARQMGKSSLMIRTARQLEAKGIQSVVLDLNLLGAEISIEEWYLGLAYEIADRLGLESEIKQWWEEHSQLGATQRLGLFFKDFLLDKITGRLVIFIDEIDVTLAFNFRDDFFALIRQLYNERSTDARLSRLSFVLIGVATPSELMSDQFRTPLQHRHGHRADRLHFRRGAPAGERAGAR